MHNADYAVARRLCIHLSVMLWYTLA